MVIQTRPETLSREAAHVFLCGRFGSKGFGVCPCISDLFQSQRAGLFGRRARNSFCAYRKMDMRGALIAFILVPEGETNASSVNS